MKTVDLYATVFISLPGGKDQGKLLKTKMFAHHDVMEMGTVRQWIRRAFNTALKTAGRNQIVTASYTGQLNKPPYTIYSDTLTGVNGKTIINF